jgi:hypothetical protein
VYVAKQINQVQTNSQGKFESEAPDTDAPKELPESLFLGGMGCYGESLFMGLANRVSPFL